jgi:hypothetical protein
MLWIRGLLHTFHVSIRDISSILVFAVGLSRTCSIRVGTFQFSWYVAEKVLRVFEVHAIQFCRISIGFIMYNYKINNLIVAISSSQDVYKNTNKIILPDL